MVDTIFQTNFLSPQAKRPRKKSASKDLELPPREVSIPLWISVSEAAKFGGVQSKTIRRAIEANLLAFKVVGNRYQINLKSLIDFLFKSTKLKNKFIKNGLGQYVQIWKQ